MTVDDNERTRRDPTPFVGLPAQLTFSGVVAHSTVAQSFELTNRAPAWNNVRLAIVGLDAAAFVTDQPNEISIPEGPKKGQMPRIEIRCVPHKEGPLEAVLLINHDFGQQHVLLRGSAIVGDGTVTPRDGALPGVSNMPVTTRGDDLSGRLHQAARHGAELCERYNSVSPLVDDALAKLGQNAGKAANRLNGAILSWLRDEGIDDVADITKNESSWIATGAKWLTVKAVEEIAGVVGGPVVVKIATKVADVALGSADKNGDELKHAFDKSEYDKDINSIYRNAGAVSEQTQSIVSRAVFKASELAALKGALRLVATTQMSRQFRDAKTAERDLQAGDASSSLMVCDQMRDNIVKYMSDEAELRSQLAAVEQLSAAVISNVDIAFGEMLDKYIVARNKQLMAGRHQLIKDIVPLADEPVHVHVAGRVDLDQEPPVHLQQLEIGGIGDVSSRLWEHVAHQRIGQLPESYEVTITLYGERDEVLVLKRRDRKLQVNEMNYTFGMKLEAENGLTRIQSALADAELGAGARQ